MALIHFEIEYKVCFWIKNRLYLLVGECHSDERISVHADFHPDEQIFGYLLDPLPVSRPNESVLERPMVDMISEFEGDA